MKREFFPSKLKNGNYVKSQFIQFLNKGTCNSFLHDKGTRNIYVSAQRITNEILHSSTNIALVFEIVNHNICMFQ